MLLLFLVLFPFLFFLLFRTVQKIKFSNKDFFSKCGQIRRKLRIWSDLQQKSLMENFILCAVPLFSNFDLYSMYRESIFYNRKGYHDQIWRIGSLWGVESLETDLTHLWNHCGKVNRKNYAGSYEQGLCIVSLDNS